MRYQWIPRLLGTPLVISDEIMEPFSRLEQAAGNGAPLTLILDQSKMSDRHQVLMLALRGGERAVGQPARDPAHESGRHGGDGDGDAP